MAALAPLVMSQTKEELLRHLNLPPETYALMAKETDVIYKWLTSDRAHLKANCKRKPPYDWSDISERAKDQAMDYISKGGNQYTQYYWNLATPTDECVNWIARWFLYHKFRYRDGRNRNPASKEEAKHRHHSRSSGGGDHHSSAGGHHGYDSGGSGGFAAQNRSTGNSGGEASGTYWDPVRDV